VPHRYRLYISNKGKKKKKLLVIKTLSNDIIKLTQTINGTPWI